MSFYQMHLSVSSHQNISYNVLYSWTFKNSGLNCEGPGPMDFSSKHCKGIYFLILFVKAAYQQQAISS